ncbi:hypothetical protein MKX08_007291 [Trichoderma sp. CBMAI-0020]|nr:hypothetical protein MKX08_007291 [Trichoderma sp. CBMAI-0020]WOD45509.1 hypothetical protein [Trichoderma atroviride]
MIQVKIPEVRFCFQSLESMILVADCVIMGLSLPQIFLGQIKVGSRSTTLVNIEIELIDHHSLQNLSGCVSDCGYI